MDLSNLTAQQGLNGGAGMATAQTRASSNGASAVVDELGDVVDATPRYVAAGLLIAVGVLVALRVTGFRFSFGANIGAGG